MADANAPMTNTLTAWVLSLVSAAFAGTFGYVWHLGTRITALETGTEIRHEDNTARLDRIERAVDDIRNYLLDGRR